MAAVIGEVRSRRLASVRRRPRVGPDRQPRRRAGDRRAPSSARCSRASSRATSASCARTSGRSPRTASASERSSVAMFSNITPEFASSLGTRSLAARARGAAFLGVDAILISGPDHRDGNQSSRPARGQDGGARDARARQHRRASGDGRRSARCRRRSVRRHQPQARRCDLECRRPGARRSLHDSGATACARRSRPDMAKTRIYFVSDLHGSSVCFRKFVNAAKVVRAERDDPRR